jgi:hypothetical protein
VIPWLHHIRFSFKSPFLSCSAIALEAAGRSTPFIAEVQPSFAQVSLCYVLYACHNSSLRWFLLEQKTEKNNNAPVMLKRCIIIQQYRENSEK